VISKQNLSLGINKIAAQRTLKFSFDKLKLML